MQALLKTANIIWGAIVAQLVLFGATAFFFYKPETAVFNPTDTSITIVYIAYLLIIASVPGSYTLYSIMLKKIPKEQPEEILFVAYRKLLFVKYAILESASLFAIVAYIVSGSTNPMYAFFIPVIVLLMSKPSDAEFRKDFLPQEVENHNRFEEEVIEYEDTASDEKE